MQFEMTQPCADCPFRRDGAGYLHPARAEQIADGILTENVTFACHKTLGWYGGDDAAGDGKGACGDEDDTDEDQEPEADGRGGLAITPHSQHCAGALIFAAKHADNAMTSNAMLQIAERFGLYDSTHLNPAAFALVFDTKAEMVEHHGQSCGSYRHQPAPATTEGNAVTAGSTTP